MGNIVPLRVITDCEDILNTFVIMNNKIMSGVQVFKYRAMVNSINECYMSLFPTSCKSVDKSFKDKTSKFKNKLEVIVNGPGCHDNIIRLNGKRIINAQKLSIKANAPDQELIIKIHVIDNEGMVEKKLIQDLDEFIK